MSTKRTLYYGRDKYDTDPDRKFVLIDDQNKSKYVDVKPADDAIAEELAEYCDQECENANYHDFVGAHAALVGILRESLDDEELTNAIMREIAERGGFQELAK